MIIVLLLQACDNSGPGTPGPVGDPDAMPTISLVSPQPGEGRYGTELVAEYTVENFTLDGAAIGGPDEEGVGHVHAYLDGALVGEIAETTYTYTDVTSGEHVLTFRLASNSHEEIGAGAEVTVPTRVPTLAILSPAEGAVLDASNALFSLSVDDFDVSTTTAAAAPAFGGGRVNVYVDDVLTDLAVDPVNVMVSPLVEGVHTVTLELATADGAPIEPRVSDTIALEVAPGSPAIAIDRSKFMGAYDSATAPLAITATNVPLEYHVYVDGTYYVGGTEPQLSLLHLAPGYHYVEVRLTDGGSEGTISDHAHVFVTADRPDVRITAPGDQWGVAPDVDVTVEAENFTWDANLGGANVDGGGHWGVLVDGVDVAESATGTASLTGLAGGDHVVRVELRNNDRTPVDPPVYDQIMVTVE